MGRDKKHITPMPDGPLTVGGLLTILQASPKDAVVILDFEIESQGGALRGFAPATGVSLVPEFRLPMRYGSVSYGSPESASVLVIGSGDCLGPLREYLYGP
jgi:hypothetical protein